MSKLPILIFFALLFSLAKSKCQTGYFTDSSPCDTKATLIECKEWTRRNVGDSPLNYFYIPLRNIEGKFELEFKVDTPYHDVYVNYQSVDSENLPDSNHYDSEFEIQEHGEEIHTRYLTTNRVVNKNEGVMVLAYENRYSGTENVNVRYFTETGDCKRPGNKLGVIIGVSVGALLMCGLGAFSLHMARKRRQRNALRRQNENRPEPEVQSILLSQSPRIQNQNKNADLLTVEDLQKYFPKKPFENLKNPFQQTGCSVCLEDFAPKTLCLQLYCNHIFHEVCVQKWLEKHNNCPGCRVPIGKKEFEEFLQKQKKVKEDDILSASEIQIQSREEMVNEKGCFYDQDRV